MRAREAARAILDAALAAGDVGPLVRRALAVDGAEVRCGGRRVGLAPGARVVVLGCGKAAASMARAVEEVLGDRIAAGIVVVKDGYAAPTSVVEIAEAGHPVPDERGLVVAARLLELAGTARAGDLVLFLVSGGGSALTPAPAAPITLAEKQTVTRMLLAAGAPIGELNAVRKHLSRLKGGQLARAAAPATVLTLALSDVIGDPLDVIASGPTAPDSTTFAEALDVLARRSLLGRVPASVRARLEAGARGAVEETPKADDPLFDRVTNLVIGNNALVVEAAAEAASRLGYAPIVLTRELQGEARDAARDFVAATRALARPAALLAGGETTVTVTGPGRGGRCQEFALAGALALEPGEDLVLLAAGTDGTDGPTDAAGGLVDAGSVSRAAARGIPAAAALADNDAHAFLLAAGDLVVTGPTRTNLLDLYVGLRPRARSAGDAVQLGRIEDRDAARPQGCPPEGHSGGGEVHPQPRGMLPGMSRQNLVGLLPSELEDLAVELGASRYRGRQLATWMYRKGVLDLGQMTDLPREFREALAGRATIAIPAVDQVIASGDGSRKLVLGLGDGNRVSAVLMPDDGRVTLCLSTQVGCGYACAFCLTGTMGLERNVRAGEIVGQLLAASALLPADQRPTHLVFMGMGEPLASLDAVVPAIRIFTDPRLGFGYSPRRVTVSTVGLVKGIDRLAREQLRVNLAISLHAASDEVRTRLMPVNRAWSLEALMAAVRRYPLAPRQRVFFEYVLLEGVNDTPEDARRLVRLLAGVRAKVNLIPFNDWEGAPFRRPPLARILAFQSLLLEAGLTTTVRWSKGEDIGAACGQLREPVRA